MKKVIISILAVVMTMTMALSVSAEKPAFDPAKWEDVFTGSFIDASANGISIKGSGYSHDKRAKFMYRHKVAYDISKSSITIKFPDKFDSSFEEADWTYWIGFANAPIKWVNEVPSIVFIVRPLANNKVKVEMAGNNGTGWGGTGEVDEPLEVTLDSSRKVKFELKKVGDSHVAFINGKEFQGLNEAAQKAVDRFRNGKCYPMLGATAELDPEGKKMLSFEIADMEGKLASSGGTTSTATSSKSAATSSASIGTGSQSESNPTTSNSETSSAQESTDSIDSDVIVDSSVADVSSQESTVGTDTDNDTKDGMNPAIIVLIVVIAVCVVGAGVAFVIYKKKANGSTK